MGLRWARRLLIYLDRYGPVLNTEVDVDSGPHAYPPLSDYGTPASRHIEAALPPIRLIAYGVMSPVALCALLVNACRGGSADLSREL